jgi:glycosyltransferase involved in cell wall biosynthesis
MKILHILLSIDPDYGGPALSAPSLAAAQASLGHEVSLAFYEPNPERNSVQQAILNIPGLSLVSLIPLGDRGILEKALARRARTLLREHIRASDFVHIHDMWQPYLAQAAMLASHSMIPYAISPHGTLNSWSLAQKPIRKWLALALVWRRLLDRAAFIHALNKTEATEIRSAGLCGEVAIAPNGAFLVPPEAMPQPGIFRRAFQLSPTRPFVLFLGRLHANKGVDLLVDAFRLLSTRFPEVDLVITGPDEGAKAALRQQVAMHELGTRVSFTGAVYGLDKLAAYVDATVFCLPSRGEAFSMAVVEAMAAGAPVVLTSRCNFPEAAAADAALVCDLSTGALADSLARMLESPALRQRCADNGRRLVEAEYSWEGVAQRIIARYEAAHQLRAARQKDINER